MASIYGSTNKSSWTFKLEVTELSTNISTNASRVTVDVYLGRSGSASYMYGANISCTVGMTGCANQVVSYINSSRVDVAAGGWLKLGSTTFESVPHNADGSKVVYVSASFTNNISPSSGSAGGNVTLTDIPRASTFGTITGNTIGSDMTVEIVRNSASFTHQMWYKVGNSKWYDLGTGIGTSKTFTIDMETLWQTINATSVNAQLCIRTFSGTTQIGNDVYKDVVVYVPESIVPTVSYEVTEEEGYMARFGSHIQGKSKLAIAIQTSGNYGSTIKSCTTSFDGKTYTETSFTTDALVNSGELDLIITVTDSRGRTTTVSEKIRVMAYNPPRITSLLIKRTDENGVSDSGGAYLTAIFDAEVTKLDENVGVGYRQNEAVYKAKYINKANSSDTKEEVFLFDAYNVQGGTYTFPANISSSYDFTLIVNDFFTQQSNTPTTTNAIGGTAEKTFSVFKRGLGLAFGKVAELEGFLDVNFKTFFRKIVVLKNMVSLMAENSNGEYRDIMHMTATDNLKIGYDGYDKQEGSTDIVGNDINFMFRNGMWINGHPFDFIVDQGKGQGWYYRKWFSGNSECWAQPTVNVNPTNVWGGLKYASGGGYAFVTDLFIETPYMYVTTTDESGSTWATCRVPTKDETKEIYIISADSFPSKMDVTLYIYAKGKWK